MRKRQEKYWEKPTGIAWTRMRCFVNSLERSNWGQPRRSKVHLAARMTISVSGGARVSRNYRKKCHIRELIVDRYMRVD